MSLTGTIRRSDRRPLGTADCVMRRLSDAFPGVRFTHVAREPAVSAEIRAGSTLMQRALWCLLGVRTHYPHYHGIWDSGMGAMVQFYFEVQEPVRWIRATSYGMTGGLDANFDRLCAATGWTVMYPRF